jgi:hypothetical protein
MSEAASDSRLFSTTVDLWIEADGRRISLSHLAPGWFRCPHEVTLGPCQATLFISIDDHLRNKTIMLDAGISPDQPRTPFRPLDDVPF